MCPAGNNLVERDDWNQYHGDQLRLRVPSRLIVGTANVQRLLAGYLKPAARVLEIGFAPGKQLAFLAARRGAEVAGIDYADRGVQVARRLFAALGLAGDLRCEDVFQSTFDDGTFDLVYSIGVIEHFTDPLPMVKAHIAHLKIGGTAVIIVPDYSGLYGRLQRYFDPNNLDIHNLDIMNPPALRSLGESAGATDVEVFRYGRFDPSLITWTGRLPAGLSRLLHHGLNIVGRLQPVEVSALCPWYVLTARRARSGEHGHVLSHANNT
jgi:SAM-dependent methyltransferase